MRGDTTRIKHENTGNMPTYVDIARKFFVINQARCIDFENEKIHSLDLYI